MNWKLNLARHILIQFSFKLGNRSAHDAILNLVVKRTEIYCAIQRLHRNMYQAVSAEEAELLSLQY